MHDQRVRHVTASQMAELWQTVASMQEQIKALTDRLSHVEAAPERGAGTGSSAGDPTVAGA
jgi:uncharacterized coiled-coil protein SlyX